jgi:hypothetical protein
MQKKFQRMTEDFVCEKCGANVSGNGYTNHCPECLSSKHVDINPGDRAAACGGLMEPIGVEKKGSVWNIVQKCIRCGFVRKNKTDERDSFEKIIEISKMGR